MFFISNYTFPHQWTTGIMYHSTTILKEEGAQHMACLNTFSFDKLLPLYLVSRRIASCVERSRVNIDHRMNLCIWDAISNGSTLRIRHLLWHCCCSRLRIDLEIFLFGTWPFFLSVSLIRGGAEPPSLDEFGLVCCAVGGCLWYKGFCFSFRLI